MKRTLFLSCPFCHQKPADWRKLRDYWYCGHCFLAWKKKLPKIDYGKDYYQGKSNLASKLFSPLGLLFYKIRNLYAGQNQKKIWVDVGAGAGEYLKTVKAERKIGVEVSSSGRKIMAKMGLETMKETDFLKARGLRADIISFWHVLEHVENPGDYLLAAKKNLSQNGKIIIGIPNFASFEFKIFGRQWFHLQPDYHLWHFSPKSLNKMLKKTGFKIEKIDWWSVEHQPTGILQSFVNYTSSSKNILHQLIKRQAGFSHLVIKDVLKSVFWMIIGLPIALLFWVISAICHQSGTIVVRAGVLK